jgi:hypothetical protein
MAHPARTTLASLHVLILAADPAEAEAMAACLAEGAVRPRFRAAGDAAGLRAALRDGPWDVLLYLHGRPLTALAAMKILDAQGLGLPFVIVADPADESRAARHARRRP